jgi:uncharacterized protein (TIGR02687 family)
MNDVSKRLSTLFEQHKLVFWYDEAGKLKDEFDALTLDVYKRHIDNNEFGIKYDVLTAGKDDKFLIYSDKREPEYRDNWLLDLQLRAYIFSADRASMILNELGIEISYKPFVENHIEFFAAKSRMEAFAKQLESGDDEQAFALKMMATLLKCEASIEAIAIKLMYDEKSYKHISKYHLEAYLWKHIKYKYRYDVEMPTFKDFGYKLLQNHFYSYVDRSKCELNKEASLFVKGWMDSSSNKESFKVLSKRVQDDLAIAPQVQVCDVEGLLECDTYEVCEQFIISDVAKKILTDTATKEKILDICTYREHTFWYSAYENIYKAFRSAVKLKALVKECRFEWSDFTQGITRYAEQYSKIDYHYRKYVKYSNKSEHSQILKELDIIIENIYINDYLRELNDTWQPYIKDYRESTLGYQKDFYQTHVVPIVQSRQKAFVIISDAMRYECAAELKNRVVGRNRFHAQISPMVGVLPSYTQLGVASLLPNDRLSFDAKDDSVYIDGVSSKGSKNRDKILKATNERSAYIDSESFLDFNRDDGRTFAKAHDVIYIYHNEIDATGDKSASEHKVFDAVNDSFVTIEKLIKQITNVNGTQILITSDHGFLYQNTATEESEFCKVEKPENAKRFNRRFIISDALVESSCIDIFDAKALHISGNEKIALAKSINKIRLQGGGHRFVHGGATLQEMVVPLITIKKKRKDDIRDVEVSAIPISQITTNSVMISFYQEEVVSEKVKARSLKMAFYTKNGKLISNTQSFTFDSEDAHDRNRETKLKFDLKQNAGDYSGENIKLVMKKRIEGSNEEPVYKEYEIKLQLSFINDFDDF